MSQLKENSLVKNAFILSSASIICKVLGAFYQAFLYQIVGSEGVGIYLKGIYFYAMLLAISASGIPIGISKLMAEERARGKIAEANKIFKYSWIILAVIGFVFSLGLYIFSSYIAENFFKDIRTIYVLQAMAPALFVVTVMGALRGYFQGKQNMLPTAVSQIIEQIARVGFSVAIILYIMKTANYIPILKIVNGVAFGPFIGAVFGIIILFIFISKDRDRKDNAGNKVFLDNREIIKRILLFALPVTLSALMPTFLDLMEGVIIPNNLLAAGFSQKISDQMWGSFGGAVLALINLIVAISAAFATSIVPAIAAAIGRNNHKEVVRKVNLSMKMVALISVPAGFGLLLLGEPVLDLIFNASDAYTILQYSIVMVLFIGLYHNTTGILQGLGKTYIPIISLGFGLMANIILLNVLIQVEWINILAAPIAYTTAYLTAFLINYLAIKRKVRYRSTWYLWLPRVVVSGLVTALAAFAVYYPLQKLLNVAIGYTLAQIAALLASIVVAFIIYLFVLVITKSISREDAESIPKLSKYLLKIYRIVENSNDK